MKKSFRSFIIILIWIALWQAAAAAIHNTIIFVGPWETLQALAVQIFTRDFWQTILSSLLRISLGFFSAFFLGILLGSAAGHFSLLQEFLEPVTGLLQSVPVASFVILALIWIGSKNLSVLITFLVVFPVIYRNVLEGIRQTDRKLLEMAHVYHLRFWKRILYLYRPALMPYLQAACRIALGMAWKSGVAAEVIGVPAHSIGEKLYMAKIYLSTAELFAWTFVIIIVSRLFEKLFLRLLTLLGTDLPDSSLFERKQNNKSSPDTFACTSAGRTSPVSLLHVSKSFGNHPVLSDLSLTLEPGKIYCLMAPSGRGKTTLLRLLMGLELPDDGSITRPQPFRISAVFQEDRLFEFLTSVKNVRLACEKSAFFPMSERLLKELLEEDALYRPVSGLSGGMKRRVAVARALAAPSDLLLMDEPFSGLDDDTRNRVIQVILRYRNGRTLLIVTHQEEDAAKLGGSILRLS